MNTLTARDLGEIRRWVYRNARPLELCLWQYHFEGGSREAVMDALCMYRNDDGGFGRALEPDNWNEASTPYTTGYATDILENIGLDDAQHPIIQGILAYLDGESSYFAGGRWPFVIPSNNDFPHAPWWSYSEQNNEQNGYFPTLHLIPFILRYADKASALYEKAHGILKPALEKARDAAYMDAHEIHCYSGFVDDMKRAALTHLFDYEQCVSSLKARVDAAIERDATKWNVYTMMPSMFMRSPDGAFYKGNEGVMAAELQHMLSTRAPGGVWDITWRWEDYGDAFAVSANWWRSIIAINNIRMLECFGLVAR